jgi:hypothetical protein
MEFISRDDMMKYLEELNLRLKGINSSCDIIIFGGAAMALVHKAREATLDIDAKYRSSVELRRARRVLCVRTRRNGSRAGHRISTGERTERRERYHYSSTLG